MKPISFMRLRQLDKPEDILKKYKPSQIVVEQKFDGFKVMATRGRDGTRLYSRNGKELTAKAPQIVKALDKMLRPGDTVLGEMVYVSKGQQELGLVQSVLHSKAASRAIRKSEELGGKLQYYVYDVLEKGGKNISSLGFSSRRKILEAMIPGRGDVRRSKIYTWGRRKDAMKRAIASGGEGIVIKVKDAPYIYRRAGQSEPHGKWWKHKVPGEKAHTEDVILLGYAKREKRLAFKMYQIENGKRVFVGYISNLPRVTEKEVQKLSDRGKAIVAEISHQERFPSGKFRHPGWIRLRPDKPVRSATMTRRAQSGRMRNPNEGMPKQKEHSVFVVAQQRGVAYVSAFSSRDHTQPALAAKECALVILGEGGAEEVYTARDEKELAKVLRKKAAGMRIRSKSQPKRVPNPRRSKVKDALAIEATRYKKFEDFSRAYWEECSRGIYWYATNEKRFYIGDHEEAQISAGKFFVSCNPELALQGKNAGKKYVAELDVSRLPGNAISVKRGSGGAEIRIVDHARSVKVMRVMDAEQAIRSLRWQQSILPSSKEELRLFWERAWEKRRKESARAAMRARKKAEREERRAEARAREEEHEKERASKKKAKKEARRKSARIRAGEASLQARRRRREADAKRARAAEREEKAAKREAERVKKEREKAAKKKTTKKKSSKKKTSKKKTQWRRAKPEDLASNPSAPSRKIPHYINNPGC